MSQQEPHKDEIPRDAFKKFCDALSLLPQKQIEQFDRFLAAMDRMGDEQFRDLFKEFNQAASQKLANHSNSLGEEQQKNVRNKSVKGKSWQIFKVAFFNIANVVSPRNSVIERLSSKNLIASESRLIESMASMYAEQLGPDAASDCMPEFYQRHKSYLKYQLKNAEKREMPIFAGLMRLSMQRVTREMFIDEAFEIGYGIGEPKTSELKQLWDQAFEKTYGFAGIFNKTATADKLEEFIKAANENFETSRFTAYDVEGYDHWDAPRELLQLVAENLRRQVLPKP